jgi:hypothetical protein
MLETLGKLLHQLNTLKTSTMKADMNFGDRASLHLFFYNPFSSPHASMPLASAELPNPTATQSFQLFQFPLPPPSP